MPAPEAVADVPDALHCDACAVTAKAILHLAGRDCVNTGHRCPNLATAIPSVKNGGISDDGLEYTSRLKRGIKGHGGRPYTAADVVFSWKLVMNPNFVASLRAGYDQIESVLSPNPYTVRLRLKAPYAPTLTLWSDTYIVPASGGPNWRPGGDDFDGRRGIMKTLTRRRFVEMAAASGASAILTTVLPFARGAAASFDWKRFSGTSLRFLLDAHDWSKDLVPRRLPEFEALTGMKVTWEVYPEDQFRQKLTLNLRSDPESVDGYMSLTSWDGLAFWKAGWYEPLEKYIHSPDLTNPDFDVQDFFPNTIKIATVQGTLIGIPLYPEVQLLYYHKEKFEQSGLRIPQTVEQFVDTAGKMYDPKSGFAGYISRGEGLQAVYTLAPFLFAMGGRWLDDKGRPLLDTEPFIKALEIYGGTLHKYGPPGIAGMSWAQATVLFAQGGGAMLTDSSNFVSTFEDPSKSKIAGKVGYAMLPRGPAGVHSTLISWALSINSKSRHKEAAWYLIQWLTGKEMERQMASRKIPVARQSVWNSQTFQQALPKDWLSNFLREIPTAAVNQANPLVVPVPEVRDAIGKAIVSVIQGGDARSAAREAQRDVLRILKMS